MLTESQIDTLIERLDDSGGATGSYWEMLKHAEKNGFDLATMKSGLRPSIFSDLYDLPKPEDESEERELILALRDKMRREMSLPPLSSEERSDWRWESSAPSRRYRYTGPRVMNAQREMTRDEVAAAVFYIRSRYPEALRYANAVRAHNDALGVNGGPNDHFIIRGAWHFNFIADAICEVIGETGDVRLAMSYNEIAWALAYPDQGSKVGLW